MRFLSCSARILVARTELRLNRQARPVAAQSSPKARAGILAMLAVLASPVPAQTPDALVAPGRFVNLGTHRLHVHCIGSGAPTVVIDAGLGGSALEWLPIQEDVAGLTRVCAYDRAGYGWSDPGPAPRTAAQAVDELHAMLAIAGEAPPFILLGHSFGGFNARLMAATYPAEVDGLILVESSHPDELPIADGRVHAARNAIDPGRFVASAARRPAHLEAAQFLNTRRKALFAQMDELAHFADSASQVSAAGMLPPVPLTVVARDADVGTDAARERHWQDLQRGLSRLVPGGRLVVARGSGHNVHLERPDVVVAAVGGVIRRLRGARP
jgi:pimeloyl-ACP methyl ester carboxylesterase